MDEKIILQVHGLVKQYPEKRAVDSISFKLKMGEFLVLLGENGSGKSTLINILAGVDLNYSGNAKVFGVLPSNLHAKKKRGVVFQEHKLDSYLSGKEHLLAHGFFYKMPKKEIEEASAKLLKFVHLEDYADKPIKTYSAGMIRRLEIARALLHNPTILLLDEPTSDLDSGIKKKIWQYLKELKKDLNLSVLLATHDLKEAAELSDRIIVLENGKKKLELSKKQINEKMLSEII